MRQEVIPATEASTTVSRYQYLPAAIVGDRT